MRPIWILAFGLALLCTPAEAVPCRADSCEKQEDRDASSIQLKPTHPGDRSYGAWRILIDDLPLGLFKKDELPPGLRNTDELRPDLRDEIDWRAREWRERIATLPAVPRQDPGSPTLTPDGRGDFHP